MIIRKIEPLKAQRKLWVCGYARVSTDKYDQLESLEVQRSYYEAFIRHNPRWEFAGVYADPGRSATSADNRPDFQRMIADARAGRLDVILVKSISRFARNVSDAQRYVHLLRECDVEVRFEKEAISSFDPSADFVFSVLAAVAQEESRSISENVKWSYRRNAEKGVRRLGNNHVLGYDMGKDGKLVPNGDAWIVKMIFEDYAEGCPLSEIIQKLNGAGARRLRSEKLFEAPIILHILTNEVYIGDRLLQKEAPQHYLSKKPDVNETCESRYLEGNHVGIVDHDLWERAQSRLKKEQTERLYGVHRRASAHFLYGMVFCGRCGAPYKRKTIRGKEGTVKVWKCADRLLGAKGNGCEGNIISEEELLRLICEQLGWEWTGVDSFDVGALRVAVARVDIVEGGIWVRRMEAA